MPPLKNAPSSMEMRAATTSPVKRAFAADVDAVGGMHVAAHLAKNHNFASHDVGRDLAVAADSDAIAGEVDCAFDFAIDVERLGAGDLALDDEALADGGLFAVGDRSCCCRARRAVCVKGGGGCRTHGFGGGRCAAGLIWFPHRLILPFLFVLLDHDLRPRGIVAATALLSSKILLCQPTYEPFTAFNVGAP